MATINIKVSTAEKKWLQRMANFHGISLSELMKTYSLDQLEDEYDAQIYQTAHQKWLADGKRTVSLQTMLAEFGNSNRH
ncbi:antitoxin [Lactiplantibacillus garii]|uniref:Antitoxin n=1 Tax=Lactiplantibacillus garii TaxID=2306423 RepID=A0A426D5U7_9LACO|nr:DUF6290 family protein [Lactiplantibacillus garii]RRK09938.1 antitoxin [Lactiplantibacillus garii]